MMRSLLYVPANAERFIAKAHERGADAIILDLEDAVAEEHKDAARQGLKYSVPAVGQGGAKVFVRINSGERQVEDALAACAAGARGVMIPKVQSVEAVQTLAAELGRAEAASNRPALEFIGLIEDPGAVLNAVALARAPRMIALALGGEDLAVALGAKPTPAVLNFPKLQVHYAAKAQGLLSLGLLRSIADYSDLDAIRAAVVEAREHGFDGSTCVHPSAVPLLNDGFAPSADEIAWAKRVVEMAEGNGGAFVLDGAMIDVPIVRRARAILGQ